MYFITPVISTGISRLPEMQLISLFSTAVHSWFVVCPWGATRAKHVPSLSPRHGQRLELADKQTKGHFFPGVREWLLSPLPVLQRCSTAHRCLPGFSGTHSPARLWQHLSLQDVAKHRIWLRICLWSCPFSIIQSVKLNQTFPPE